MFCCFTLIFEWVLGGVWRYPWSAGSQRYLLCLLVPGLVQSRKMDTWDSLPSECRCAPAKAFLQLYNATALPLSSGHSFNKKINQMSFSFTYAALLYINVSPLSPLSAPIALLTIDNAQLNCSEQTSVLLSSALSSSEKQKPYFCIFWPRKARQPVAPVSACGEPWRPH